MENLKAKIGTETEIYEWIIDELGPTLDDLGLYTIEELGLDMVVTELVDPAVTAFDK